MIPSSKRNFASFWAAKRLTGLSTCWLWHVEWAAHCSRRLGKLSICHGMQGSGRHCNLHHNENESQEGARRSPGAGATQRPMPRRPLAETWRWWTRCRSKPPQHTVGTCGCCTVLDLGRPVLGQALWEPN